MRKSIIALGLIMAFSIMSITTAFAGEWKSEADGFLWLYERDDKTYPVDCWEQIDGKSYHFDAAGYLDTDMITEDGYHVDENGAWIESIPQMSREEMDKYYQEYYHDLFYNSLKEFYIGGVFTDKVEFEEYAHILFSDPVEAEQIINEIRNNHTFIPFTY